jgi:UDP-2,4-diacetamido-2,4,6-trideoxy-beta-L-altropyranose hydrolase
MRCLTLADALSEQGAECRFVCREHEGHLIDHIRSRGYEAHALPKPGANAWFESDLAHASWLGVDWLADAQQTLQFLKNTRLDWLIVDHYALDHRWESALRSSCKRIMVIDDLADRRHDCDLLLDHNLRRDAAHRYSALVPSHCRLLLGPKYILVKPEFLQFPKRGRNGVIENIFVYFGSNDQDNQAARAITALAGFPQISCLVVLGNDHPHQEAVYAAADGLSHIKIVNFCSNMAAQMSRADLSLGVCGIAAWERCALGLPSIVCVTADNQREDALALDRLSAVENLGESRNVFSDDWANALTRLVSDPNRLSRMAVASRLVVDGYVDSHTKLLELLCDG